MNNHSPLVKVHVHEHTGTLILNRPDKRNALTRELIAELAQGLEDLRHERRVRAIVLSGSGAAFCAGMDLHEMQQTAARSQREGTLAQRCGGLSRFDRSHVAVAQANHCHG